jgi:hypothetical protein
MAALDSTQPACLMIASHTHQCAACVPVFPFSSRLQQGSERDVGLGQL